MSKVGLSEDAVWTILDRYLEFTRSIRAVNLEGGGGGGAWRGEPDPILWQYTVGSKLSHTPRLPLSPGNPNTRYLSAVEQVAWLRIDESSLLDVIRQEEDRLEAMGLEEPLALARDAQRDYIADLQRRLADVQDRAARILGADEYQRGMAYLRRELLRCCLVDEMFSAFASTALWEAEGPAGHLRQLMALGDLSPEQTAEILSVEPQAVRRWLLPAAAASCREVPAWAIRLLQFELGERMPGEHLALAA